MANETKINKDQIKAGAVKDIHVSDTANVAWDKISKAGAVPADVNAESPLTFSEPLIRDVNNIYIDPGAFPDIVFPITVDRGGTGLTEVASGRLLFGNTENILGTSLDLTFDSATSLLTLEGQLNIVSPSLYPLVKIQNSGSGIDLMSYQGLGSTKVRLFKEVAATTPFSTVEETSFIVSLTSGSIVLTDPTGVNFSSLLLGTSSIYNPGLFVNGTGIDFKLTDGSDFTSIRAKNITSTGAIYSNGDIFVGESGGPVVDILPTDNYGANIGSASKKFLSLHVAELDVETLIARDTLSTIGGRILVGPTTKLTAPLGDLVTDTTIEVEHNQMAPGDFVYMEAGLHVEFMSILTGPTGADPGPYSYTVTRNLDGTGRNSWSIGDAVFNTGYDGDGFIDLYALRGLKYSYDPGHSSTQEGPTIVGNVRYGLQFNSWNEYWAIGNLHGLYGYASSTYGAAFGKYSSTDTYVTIDSTNGIRFFSDTSTYSDPRIWLKTDGSGYVGNTNIQWKGDGSTNIAGWLVNASSITSGGIKLISSNTPASNMIAVSSDTTPVWNDSKTAFYVDGTGKFSLGTMLNWDPSTSTLNVAGEIGLSVDWSNVTNRPTSLATLNSTDGTKLEGIAAGATVGATWDVNVTPPDFLRTPAASGLFLNSDYLGFYDYTNSVWKSYMDHDGNFYLVDRTGGSHGLSWNGTTLSVTGTVVITGGQTATDISTALTNASNAASAASTAQSTANGAVSRLNVIDNDSIISKVEKSALIKEVQDILSEYSGIYNAALSVIKTTERAAYKAAKDTLIGANATTIETVGGYLGTLTTDTLWSDVSGDTTIPNVTTFRAVFNDYYTKRQALLNANADYAATVALWANLNKPTPLNFATDAAPGGSPGVFVTSGGIGFWNGSAWKTYIQSDGAFQLASQNSSTHGLLWNPTTGVLDIQGKITAIDGEIAGWKIAPNLLSSGTTHNGVGLSTTGTYAFYAGDTVAADADFRVKFDGSLIANNASITGAVTATSGAVGGWTIGASSLSATGINISSTSNPSLSSAIAIGTTPPTSATSGTGIWIDKTGVAGVNANVPTYKLSNLGLVINLHNDENTAWNEHKAITFVDMDLVQNPQAAAMYSNVASTTYYIPPDPTLYTYRSSLLALTTAVNSENYDVGICNIKSIGTASSEVNIEASGQLFASAKLRLNANVTPGFITKYSYAFLEAQRVTLDGTSEYDDDTGGKIFLKAGCSSTATYTNLELSKTGATLDKPLTVAGLKTDQSTYKPPFILEQNVPSGYSVQTIDSTTAADITGTSITFTPAINCRLLVYYTVDVKRNVAPSEPFIAILDVNGSEQSSQIIFSENSATLAGARNTLSNRCTVDVTGGTSYTIKLKAKITTGTGEYLIAPQHTGLSIMAVGRA